MILNISIACIIVLVSFFTSNIYVRKRFNENLYGLKVFVPVSLLLFSGLAFVLTKFHFSMIETESLIFLSSMLVVIGLIDYKHMIIPNVMLLFMAALRVIVLILECLFFGAFWKELLISTSLGMVYGSALFFVLKLIRKNSIGMGDIKLLLVVGMFLGKDSILLAVLLSALSAFVISVVKLIFKKMKAREEFSFGPFIAVGTIVAIFLGV